MGSLFTLYLGIMQNGKQMVQEGALTALASVADSSQVYYMLLPKSLLFYSIV